MKPTLFLESEKRIGLHICSVRKTNNNKIDWLEFKKKLFNVFNNRVERLLKEKEKCLVFEKRENDHLSIEKLRLNFLKTTIYHSNIENQIRKAKEKWGIQ